MKKPRFSLFSKIIFWVFLNLLLVGGILFFIFNLDFHFAPQSPFFRESANRIGAVSRLISTEIDNNSRAERDQILAKYSEAYNVEFFVFDGNGQQIAGKEKLLPDEVIERLKSAENSNPPFPSSLFPNQTPPNLSKSQRRLPPMMGRPPFFVTTNNPTLFWSGFSIPVFEKDESVPRHAYLLTASDSANGHGLFFDPTPWLIIVGVVTIVSILFWLPFVRGMTKAVSQMTEAAERIADEDFAVQVNEKRTDELGRLGKAINQMTTRLSVFVYGQKRFLGDVSHELNSPLARLQVALSVLDDYANEKTQPYLESAREDVELMSRLTDELLTYAKAGIKTAEAKLTTVKLKSLIERVVKSETANTAAEIEVECDENLTVAAQPEMLARALANVVRNAVRYAADAGKITVKTESIGEQISLIVADSGAGINEDALKRIFEPFYRIESDRSRATGGTGLGLAIVKTCIEACGGKVAARNVQPQGFEVIMTLRKS